MTIAVEDIGVGFPEAIPLTVAAASDDDWRYRSGGDADTAVYLAQVLAKAHKSRSAQHLITTARLDPQFQLEREQGANRSSEMLRG